MMYAVARELVNPFDLPSLLLSERNQLPGLAAVYFVLDGDRLLYISRTTHLRQRWVFHQKSSQINSIETDEA